MKRHRVFSAILLLALAAAGTSGCGGGGGGTAGAGGGNGGPPNAKTYTLELTGLELTDTRTGAAVDAGGLPIKGATVTRDP